MTDTDTYTRKPITKARPQPTLPPLADELAAWSDRIRSVPVDHTTHTSGPQIQARITGRELAKQRMERAVAAIKANPNGRSVDIAKACGMSHSYINDTRSRLRKAGFLIIDEIAATVAEGE